MLWFSKLERVLGNKNIQFYFIGGLNRAVGVYVPAGLFLFYFLELPSREGDSSEPNKPIVLAILFGFTF